MDLATATDAAPITAAKTKKLVWPKSMREQIATVRDVLGTHALPFELLLARFASPKTTAPLIADTLTALEELGMVVQNEGFIVWLTDASQ